MSKSKGTGDLLWERRFSKACGQHIWFWRSTGVAVQVGLRLGSVFVLETNQLPKFEGWKTRTSYSIQTPTIPDQGHMQRMDERFRHPKAVWLDRQVNVVGRDDYESWSNIYLLSCHLGFL